MSDSYNDHQNHGRNHEGTKENGRGGFRSGRNAGNREGGGFRIRLSDNEMRASRSLQEAFNLRSTVAVLGFAIRTLAQMLEEGKLDDLVAQYRSQGGRPSNRRDENSHGSRRNRFDGEKQSFSREAKPNPFARPSKPQPAATDSESDNEETAAKDYAEGNDEESKNDQAEHLQEQITENVAVEKEKEKSSHSNEN